MRFEESLAVRLRAAYLHLHRSANRHFRPFDATADQYAVMTCLAQEPGITQQTVVDQLASDKRTINRMIDLMEEKGLVERREHPDDRRAWALYLTKEGRQQQKVLYDSADYLRRRLEEAVPPGHMETILNCLIKMAENLDPDAIEGVVTRQGNSRTRT
ncbi:MAG: MarR family transcriptional regulator [Pirellulaceae bacterium]|nr:MarR family transcriptional regulator [Pirellulaceae bacterium]